MCPHQNSDSPAAPVDKADMVQVPTVNGTNGTKVNGLNANGKRGTTRTPSSGLEKQRNPYAPRASDFLSNISNFNIIESTLRGQLTCRHLY